MLSSALSGIRFIFPVILGTTVTFTDITLPSLRNKDNSVGLHFIFLGLSEPNVMTDRFSVESKVRFRPFASFSVI